MSTHLEICGGGETKPKNTGFKDQCIESKLNIPIISDGFQFPDIAAFKTVAAWKAAIKAKSLVPLFPVYELADASTEDTKFESGSFSKVTSKGVEKITFECYLSVCAYAALKSYENSGRYAELFEYNEDDDYSGIFASDGFKVKGRKITSIKVTRIRATKDKVPYVKGEITFADKDDVLNAVIVKSDLSESDLEGIFDVELIQVSATATSIKFKASAGCSGGGALVTSLTTADVVVKNAAGAVQAVSFVTADANGIYTLTGTGFANGFTLSLNGVVAQTTIMYESPEVLVIQVGIDPLAPVITSGNGLAGPTGTPLSYQITATNSPTSYSVTGTLPTGLTLNSSTGLISGTPTVASSGMFTVNAINANGTGSKSVISTIS